MDDSKFWHADISFFSVHAANSLCGISLSLRALPSPLIIVLQYSDLLTQKIYVHLFSKLHIVCCFRMCTLMCKLDNCSFKLERVIL